MADKFGEAVEMDEILLSVLFFILYPIALYFTIHFQIQNNLFYKFCFLVKTIDFYKYSALVYYDAMYTLTEKGGA